MVLEQHQHLDHRHHLAARQLLEVVPPLGEEPPHSAEVPHLALVARYLEAAEATRRQQGQVQAPVQDLQGNVQVYQSDEPKYTYLSTVRQIMVSPSV